MVHAAWYPPADRSQDRTQFSGITMQRISKCLLHSTETQGWPSYPSFAPQFTYDPWRHEWRQHMPLPRSASTLADPSWTAVRENRDDIVQVEIVGYCDPERWPTYGHNVEKMDAQAVAELGAFIAWLHDEWEVPLNAISSAGWVSYPKSYGLQAPQRLTESQFDAYEGVLGHQHASGNQHGDPGHIDIDAIMAAANSSANVETSKIIINGREYDDVSTVKVSAINAARDGGHLSRHVFYVQQWLEKVLGRSVSMPGRAGVWDAPTQAAYNEFRRSIGIAGDDALGAVGLGSLDRLRRKADASKPVAK